MGGLNAFYDTNSSPFLLSHTKNKKNFILAFLFDCREQAKEGLHAIVSNCTFGMLSLVLYTI